MSPHTLTGFGFGPIQAGLFVKEARDSGAFRRIVIAEIDQALVDAVRGNGNRYALNIAHTAGIETVTVNDVELLNPGCDTDRGHLVEALRESTEIVTALPSVDFYTVGGAQSVAAIISAGLEAGTAPATIVYAAENNNRAAEILEAAVADASQGDAARRIQFLNTVIGKMSRVVADPREISDMDLAPIAQGFERAILVEAFNHILVSRTRIPGCTPGIAVFDEKDDLLPFEEVKLYGHNAVHALLAYLGAERGCDRMNELKADTDLMMVARRAFLDESGAALVAKHAKTGDRLFTADGYRELAEDLLERMTNPFLGDTIARAARDPVRKLGYQDRIFGTMALVLEQGIEPHCMALAAAAAVRFLVRRADECGVPRELRVARTDRLGDCAVEKILNWVWGDAAGPRASELVRLVQRALGTGAS